VEYIPQNYLSAITYEDGDKYDERDQKLRELLFNNELFKNADVNITEIVNSVELKISTNIKEILKCDRQISDTKNQLKPLGKVEDKSNAIKLKQKEIEKLGKIDITKDDITNQSKYVSRILQLSNEIELAKQDIRIITNINSTTAVDFIKVTMKCSLVCQQPHSFDQ
jgi:HD-GYP domain-containing protein (c-di-GMP phosphodiesterase class II)